MNVLISTLLAKLYPSIPKHLSMQNYIILLITILSFSYCSCQSPAADEEEAMTQNEILMEDEQEGNINMNQDEQAVITEVQVSGTENNYSFSVRIKSPDTGCKQYADWWEVFDEDGNLLYRRILAHSHVDEQPFTRSGGPINISENQFVYVRAHMNPLGYGSFGFAGTVKEGLKSELISISKAKGLENAAPLPKDCAF